MLNAFLKATIATIDATIKPLIVVFAFTFTTFIEVCDIWIFSPWYALPYLALALGVDLGSAVFLSFKRGGGFETEKFWDSLAKLFFLSLVLIILHSVPRIASDMGSPEEIKTFARITQLIYWAALFNCLGSSGKNMALAKVPFMPAFMSMFFIKYFDKYKDDPSYSLNPNKKYER
jgi:hypothetical protein